jgi:hypothetical protein
MTPIRSVARSYAQAFRVERHDDLTATDYRGYQDVPVFGVASHECNSS